MRYGLFAAQRGDRGAQDFVGDHAPSQRPHQQQIKQHQAIIRRRWEGPIMSGRDCRQFMVSEKRR